MLIHRRPQRHRHRLDLLPGVAARPAQLHHVKPHPGLALAGLGHLHVELQLHPGHRELKRRPRAGRRRPRQLGPQRLHRLRKLRLLHSSTPRTPVAASESGRNGYQFRPLPMIPLSLEHWRQFRTARTADTTSACPNPVLYRPYTDIETSPSARRYPRPARLAGSHSQRGRIEMLSLSVTEEQGVTPGEFSWISAKMPDRCQISER